MDSHKSNNHSSPPPQYIDQIVVRSQRNQRQNRKNGSGMFSIVELNSGKMIKKRKKKKEKPFISYEAQARLVHSLRGDSLITRRRFRFFLTVCRAVKTTSKIRTRFIFQTAARILKFRPEAGQYRAESVRVCFGVKCHAVF